MTILTIDTATIVASIAILNDEKLIGEMIINHKKKHSEKLMVAIDHLLKDGGLSIDDIDAFGIVAGPGSFTGLRIGMATAKGFAQALDKPLIAVSTLASLAMNIPFSENFICPILDAQRKQVYAGLFHFQGEELVQDLADSVLAIEALIESIRGQKKLVYLLGDGLGRFSKTILAACPNARIVPNYLNMNRASSAAALVLKKAERGEYEDFRKLQPVYIRPSYAEEKKG